MDIPIDGPVENMIIELQKKGFRYTPERNNQNMYLLEGTFNGAWADISVSVNRDKVSAVGVIYKVIGAENAKLRFNSLHAQMAKNWKYYNFQEASIPFIADNVDIEYELKYKKTNFDAIFFQVLTNSAQVMALKEYIRSLGGKPENKSIEEKDKELIALTWMENLHKHTSPITQKYKHKSIEEMDSLEKKKYTNELIQANEKAMTEIKNPEYVNRRVSMTLKHIMADHYAIYMLYYDYNNSNGEDL